MKALFPKTKVGGYTARIRFNDEARGERFFDAEWSVGKIDKGTFTLFHAVNFRGNNVYEAPAGQTIGQFFRKGDRISLSITKHTPRGRSHVPGRAIEILAVEINEDKTVRVVYQ